MDVKTYLRAQWDRVLAGVLVALGGLSLFLGWLGISGAAAGYRQLPYLISGGVTGVALIGLGATLYLSADMRDEWRKLDRLEHEVRALGELLVTRPSPVDHTVGAGPSPDAADAMADPNGAGPSPRRSPSRRREVR